MLSSISWESYKIIKTYANAPHTRNENKSALNNKIKIWPIYYFAHILFGSYMLNESRIYLEYRKKYLKKTQNSITEIGCVNSFDFRSIEFLADRLLLWTFVNINSSLCDAPSNLLKLWKVFRVVVKVNRLAENWTTGWKWTVLKMYVNRKCSLDSFLLLIRLFMVSLQFGFWFCFHTVVFLLIIIKNWVQVFLKDFPSQMNNLEQPKS